MDKEKKSLSKLNYREFTNFMRRYEKETNRREKKEKFANPYKYVKVFNKDTKK